MDLSHTVYDGDDNDEDDEGDDDDEGGDGDDDDDDNDGDDDDDDDDEDVEDGDDDDNDAQGHLLYENKSLQAKKTRETIKSMAGPGDWWQVAKFRKHSNDTNAA